jgi:hypothetical protein
VLLTLNQVISQITTLAAAHSQIAASGVGDFAEWQAEERNYPLLWVFHETTNVGNRELVYSIRLICADRVITGEEGEDTDGMEQEVLSDTLLILLDFLAYFQQQHSQTYTVIPSATIDPFTERFNDRVAGNSMVIQIRQPFTWDACQIPQSGATIPPTVDGLTLYDFCDPSVIARLTAEQVACLEAEYALPCADVTQQVNGTTIGTTVSGGTNNQLIRNTAGTAVGTSANPSIVANSTYTLKKSGGTTISTGSIAAEASANITAPDATAVVKDTANNTISTTPIQSDSSANITAPDGTYSLRDTASNVLGTGSIRSGQLAVVITAPDATVTINGASLGATGTIRSGGSEDLDVLQGGVAAGSWNGSAWIIPTCPAAPSLSVALSDTTPNFGDVVLITATPTGITPTSYTFIIPLKDGTLTRTTQAGNTLNWTAVYTGAQKISVEATNGSAWVSDDVDVTVSYVIANGLILNGTNWLSTANGTFNRLLNANIWQMSMWFNATSLANLPIIFAGTASNMFVEVDATHVYVNVGGVLRTYNQVVSTATRYNLVIQKTALGNNLTVYLNGVALALTSGSSGDLLPLNQGAYIGRYWSGGFELSGKIKDVSFFNSFNSSLAQVTAYYNAGSGSHPVTLGQFPDVWYWLESNPNDYGRLGINATAANSPTYGAF